MYISYNASAVLANNALNKTDNRLQDALARLSSGLKVVNPKDNPSGLAMARRMNAQIIGVGQANNNASDGVSIIEIADGTMSEITEMIQRMNELATKAANGTLKDDDRQMIDQEVQQLKAEITRIGKETSFNGQPILDGSFDLKGYTSENSLKVAYYSDSVVYTDYTLNELSGIKYNDDGTINEKDSNFVVDITGGNVPDASDIVTTASGNTITLKDDKGWELKLEVKKESDSTKRITSFPTDGKGINIDITGIGSMDMQIGANEGQQLGIRIPKMSLENMEIANIDVTTQENAEDAMNKLKGALKYVSASRANLGAYQNRLEHTISSLDITEENMTAAYSRIMDVDMAEEMTNYTTLTVLSQASTSMLAQANDRPSQVLQLLQ